VYRVKVNPIFKGGLDRK